MADPEPITVLEKPVRPERSTWRYATVLKDETGALITSAVLTTLTLTLIALPGKQVINSRNAVPITTALDANGNLVFVFTPADGAIIDDALDVERHQALFQVTWASGAKGMNHVIEFPVKNLHTIP